MNASTAGSIGDYLISSRDFGEYTAMFAVGDHDLGGGVLDCPGGGASFTASACARGIDARAVDPVYAVPPDQLAPRLEQEVRRGSAYARSHADRYVWDFFVDPDGLARRRAESVRRFVADRWAHPERYVAASLPRLPVDDASVDLVLSSHLLFTYADRLDQGFHLAALMEMARVARREVRVYPLLDHTGDSRQRLLDGLLAELQERALPAELRAVDYEFQRGARQMLVVDARGASAACWIRRGARSDRARLDRPSLSPAKPSGLPSNARRSPPQAAGTVRPESESDRLEPESRTTGGYCCPDGRLGRSWAGDASTSWWAWCAASSSAGVTGSTRSSKKNREMLARSRPERVPRRRTPFSSSSSATGAGRYGSCCTSSHCRTAGSGS